jgi:hypothetical protein
VTFSPNKRQVVLGVISVLTLAAVGVTYWRGEPEVVAPVIKGSAAPAARVDSLDISRLRQKAPAGGSRTGQAFGAKSWYVPPPAPPHAVVAPPPPTAPPLPFAYLGRFQENGAAAVILLTRGERLYLVNVGDVIDETYRVETLTPSEVVFIYLPMDQRQVLRIAEAS